MASGPDGIFISLKDEPKHILYKITLIYLNKSVAMKGLFDITRDLLCFACSSFHSPFPLLSASLSWESSSMLTSCWAAPMMAFAKSVRCCQKKNKKKRKKEKKRRKQGALNNWSKVFHQMNVHQKKYHGLFLKLEKCIDQWNLVSLQAASHFTIVNNTASTFKLVSSSEAGENLGVLAEFPDVPERLAHKHMQILEDAMKSLRLSLHVTPN